MNIIEYFTKNPQKLDSHKYSCSHIRRIKAFKNLNNNEIAKARNKVKSNLLLRDGEIPLITEEIEDRSLGNRKITVTSFKPLSPKEIEKLANVDNLTTFVDRTWLKSHKNGIWTYSILTVSKVKDLSIEKIENKLKSIFPKIKPVTFTKIKKYSNALLTINVSDIHAGAVNSKDNIFGKKYSGTILMDRLLQLVEKVKHFTNNKKYNKLIIFNLGDDCDGWDGFTTSKKHSLGSQTNEEQFDIYTTAMSIFYSSIFSLNLSNNVQIVNCLNSNHSGNGLSYIANKAVELFLKHKYPKVDFIQQKAFIETYQWKNHVIASCHGKDDHLMKYPMRQILDDKIDNWLQQYFLSKGFNPSTNYLHLLKGDQHISNQQIGKFGRWVNVASIYGASDYVALNYGNSMAGALIEEYKENSRDIISLPIWLD